MNLDDKDYAVWLEGDKRGFEELVIRHKDHMIYFIQRYVPSFVDAEDLAQDVFVEVLLHPERYQLGRGFKTYLYTIAHNKAVDWVRKHSKEVLTEEYPEEADSFTLEQHVLDQERKNELARVIKQLKPEEQMLLLLADVEELSYKEIAEVMGLSLPQTKVRIHRLRHKMRDILQREGLTYEK